MKKLFTAIALLIFATGFAQNVGIGTTTPTKPLTIKADGIGVSQESSTGGAKIGFYTSATNAYIQTHSASDLKFATNDSSFTMILKRGSGNLGIGQVNPTAKLDVNGTVKITDGSQGINKVLTSDAAGNATWQNAAYGTNERFQFNITRQAPSNSSATFNTFYNFGTASGYNSGGLAPNGIPRTIVINISKPGLYHFDCNLYSYYGAGLYTNDGRKLFEITKCVPGPVCTKVLKTYTSYDANSYLVFDRNFEIYISEPGTTLYFTTEASFDATYDNFYMTITGHLISE
jgi:hypothetical protein